MLSFNALGRYGRLGNQMFQYASLKGIARHRGYQFTIPASNNHDEWNDHQLSQCFALDDGIEYMSVPSQSLYQEPYFHFNEALFNECHDGVDLLGYFQTEKYFSDIREELLNDFSFKEQFDKPLDSYTALHVRRGDYVNQPQYHPVCSLDYYNNAIKITGGPIIVMSDDIAWCKENIDADIYLEGTSNVYDLYVMSQADNNIIANSSFSWWGAWLNNNHDKVVVSPKNWFGEAYSNYNMDDLRPESWIQL